MNRTGRQLVTVASWLLFAGLFAAPFTLGYLQEERNLWAHLALCLVLGLAAVGVALGGAPKPSWRRTDLLLLALLLVYLAASFRTVHVHATLAELMRLADYLALYLLVRCLCRTPDLLLAAAGAFAAGATVCAAKGVQEYLLTLAGSDSSWRAFGPFFNPNLLAAMLLMAIPVCVALLSAARSLALRAACAFALLLCWGGFFLTGSKGGALALLGALLLGAALAPDPSRRGASRRAVLAIVVVGVALAAALFLPPIRIRLAAALGSQSNSTMFRYYTWLGTWHMVLAHPILGFGPGAFAAAYPRFALVGFTQLAHQTYLQVAAETGFPGALGFVAVLATWLLSAVGGARRLSGLPRAVSAAAAAGLLGFCLHNLVDYGWHVTATGMVFCVLAGLAAAAGEVSEAPPEPAAAEVSLPPSARKRRRHPAPIPVAPVARSSPAWAVAVAVTVLLAAAPAGLALSAAQRARQGDLHGASRLDPLNPEYHQHAAALAEQLGRQGLTSAYDEAVTEWRVVERLRPTYPGTHLHLAQIRQDEGRYPDAREEYRRTLELAPTWTRALVDEARFLETTGDKPQALEVYRRLNALSDGPLFRYRAIENDLDPNFAYAWVALADAGPAPQARAQYVRTAKYLRQVFQANRAFEGLWRAAGEWDDKQGPELADLAEVVARHHLSFPEPGARLRAALLLVDAGRAELARQLFVTPDGLASEGFFGRIIGGWSSYTTSLHLRQTDDRKGADALLATAAAALAEALRQREWVAQLTVGADALTPEELAALKRVAESPPPRS